MADRREANPELARENLARISAYADEAHVLPEGSFSQIFYSEVELDGLTIEKVQYHHTLYGIIDKVLRGGDANEQLVGVVPVDVRNSGPVQEAQKPLMDGDLEMLAHGRLVVEYVLAGKGKIEDIKQVYSHPKGHDATTAQRKTMGVIAKNANSTAEAAGEVAAFTTGEGEVAAICSHAAAVQYDLPILDAHFANDLTEFAIVKARTPDSPPLDKLTEFESESIVQVSGLVVPTVSEWRGGILGTFNYFAGPDPEYPVVSAVQRGRRGWHDDESGESEGGDAEYFVTLRGSAADLHAKLTSPEREKYMRLFDQIGIYPVGSVYHERRREERRNH